MRSPVLVALCLLLAGAAGASEGMAYLKIPQGARSSAMGSAMVARRAGVEGMWYNPAAIHGGSLVEASFSRMSWIGATHDDYLAVSTRLSGRHSLGIYANWLSAEDTYRDALGNESGSFLNSASVFGMAWGVDWGAFGVGVGLKQAHESLAGRDMTAAAFDLGVQWGFLEKRLRFGAAAQNIGDGYAYNSVYPPLTFRGGVSIENVYPGLIISAEYRRLPQSNEAGGSAGAEYGFKAGKFDLALRGGYEAAAARLGDMGGLTLGGGVRMDELQADFAWLPQGALGNPYRMTVSWLYGKEPTGPAPREPYRSRRRERVREPEEEDEALPPEPKLSLPPLPGVDSGGGGSPESDLLLAGKELEEAGRMERAEKLYERLVSDYPKSTAAWKALGRLRWKLGRKESALRAFERVQELRPSDALREWLDNQGSKAPE